ICQQPRRMTLDRSLQLLADMQFSVNFFARMPGSQRSTLRRAFMKGMRVLTLFFAVLVAVVFAQQRSDGNSVSMQRSNVEMKAITNLRKFAIGESRYAMSHPSDGFACDAQILTRLEWWPNSDAKLLEPALLTGAGNYKFSASCPKESKPGHKLNILAV